MAHHQQPHYRQLPLYHREWRSMVAMGTFGLLEDGSPVQILWGGGIEPGQDHDNDVEDKTVTLLTFTITSQSHPTICHRIVSSEGQLVQKKISSITRLAWCFNFDHFQHCDYQLGDGVDNIFLWEQAVSFFPFPDQSPDYPFDQPSLSLTTFKDLQRICDAADKILNRAAESQGTWVRARSSTFPVNKTTINYMKEKMSCSEVHKVCLRSSRKRTRSGMETHLFGIAKDWSILRFQSDEDFWNLLCTFGPTMLLGNRTRRPKMGNPFIPRAGGFINIVKAEAMDDDDFIWRTDHQGIDMAFDGTDFRLTIRYQRLDVRSMSSGNYLTGQLKRTYRHRLVATSNVEEDENEQAEDIPYHLM